MTTKRLSIPVTGMTCTNCANTITRTLKRTEGVVEANVNFANERAEIIYDPAVLKPVELMQQHRGRRLRRARGDGWTCPSPA